jgi:predicted Zn-dependent protease
MSESTQAQFVALTERLCRQLHDSEVLLLNLHAENSDFVRFNHGRVRQAGAVSQRRLSLELVEDQRHAQGHVELCGDISHDQLQLTDLLCGLRAQCRVLPPDPFACYASKAPSTQDDDRVEPPDAHRAAESVARASAGLDLVGFLASGDIEVGFANSMGQLNWHRRGGFNLDWSCHLADDKAVKCAYAGTRWEPARLEQSLADARRQLDALKRPSVTIKPGLYRAVLAPQALLEILDVIAWDSFGLLSQRTRRTPLIKLLDQHCALDPAVVLRENHTVALAPGFTSQGFAKTPRITLVEGGHLGQALVGPRSSKEFGVPVNDDSERPESLELLPGNIPQREVLQRLGTGLYISNAWYCNLSDRTECRVTGMTRFACYWVEGGDIRGPLDVMRFDISLYDLLGKNLIGLTQEPQLIQDPGTYQHRSLGTARLPGALVESFRLTL